MKLLLGLRDWKSSLYEWRTIERFPVVPADRTVPCGFRLQEFVVCGLEGAVFVRSAVAVRSNNSYLNFFAKFTVVQY